MELLAAPDFFAPAVAPAAIQLGPKSHFTFASPVRTFSARNNTVPGRLERGGRDWQHCPSVVLLHGWNGELQYRWHFPMLAQLLARAGINAVMFELPYHGTRKPNEPGAIRNFLSGNLQHVMQATHQALAETRALTQWLQAQGSPIVGVWGISLGAWLAGLAIAHQPEIEVGVLMTPVVRMERALGELEFCAPIREQLAGLAQHCAPLNLVAHPLRANPENVLVVASRYDLFAPTETIDELEAAWRPVVWRVAHGHISILLATRQMQRIVKWMRTRLREARRQPAAA